MHLCQTCACVPCKLCDYCQMCCMPKICTYTCASPPICINLHQYNLHLNEYQFSLHDISMYWCISIYTSIYIDISTITPWLVRMTQDFFIWPFFSQLQWYLVHGKRISDVHWCPLLISYEANAVRRAWVYSAKLPNWNMPNSKSVTFGSTFEYFLHATIYFDILQCLARQIWGILKDQIITKPTSCKNGTWIGTKIKFWSPQW